MEFVMLVLLINNAGPNSVKLSTNDLLEQYKIDSKDISILSPPQNKMWTPQSVDTFVFLTTEG
jgi:hypothetical protein